MVDGFAWLIARAPGAWLLAQEAAPPAEPADPPSFFTSLLVPMMVVFFLYYFLILLPQKKEQQRKDELAKVKEKDEVITTGGIYGRVTNVQRDAGRVTLQVDEATGTKMKVSLQAIAQILGDQLSETKDKTEKDKNSDGDKA